MPLITQYNTLKMFYLLSISAILPGGLLYLRETRSVEQMPAQGSVMMAVFLGGIIYLFFHSMCFHSLARQKI